MAAYHAIEVQRNAIYSRLWRFTDSAGEPIDLTDAAFDMDVKYAEGEAVTLASFTITVTNALLGEATVAINGAAFAAVPGAKERVTLAYDLLATQLGVVMPLARGALHLTPGVSNAA